MPHSRDPEKAARQLANLRNAPPAPLGHRRSLKHGCYARVTEAELDAKAREVYDAIAADAPVKSADGSLPAHDTVLVRVLAETLIRRDRALREELRHGIEVESGPNKGKLRGVVELGLRLDGQVIGLLDRLGMSPTSRAKLGLTLAQASRTFEDAVAEGRARWDAIDAEEDSDDNAA